MRWRLGTSAALCACALAACEKAEETAGGGERGEVVRPDKNPFPSTYEPQSAAPTLIRGAEIYDGAGGHIARGDVLIEEGRVKAVGENLAAPADALVVDGAGKVVTPGVIDVHSHLGVYPSPGADAHGDGNEISGANTAGVWAQHGVWPQDPGFTRALAGGVTTLHVLPGSANLFGGRGVTLRNVRARTAQGMTFPNAPYSLKMACGENPKRVYGYGGGRFPGGKPYSRMGIIEGYRNAWIDANAYKDKWEAYWEKAEAGEKADAPKQDLAMDTLMGVLDGEILVQNHCYRADDMAQILDVAEEAGYKITAFHHAVESYKIADLLAERDICSAVWADWWGFKMEAYDGVRENAALIHSAGACAVIHSDDADGIQRLNQEAAKAWADGVRLGVDIPKEEAMTWIFLNAAKMLGVAGEVGSLEPGKRGDVVVWSADPFSVYAQAELVFVDGVLSFDRANPDVSPRTDFELGQVGKGPTGGAGE